MFHRMNIVTFIITLLTTFPIIVVAGPNEMTDSGSIQLKGKWLQDLDQDFVRDPQSSALVFHNDKLYSLSDASAASHNIRRLHQIEPKTAQVIAKIGPTVLSQNVRQGCFAPYLSGRPDYEALVKDPSHPARWITVTEDARRSEPLTPECQRKYAATNSTQYPTLLVSWLLQGGELIVDAVRPVTFPSTAELGDFPNDGVEGLAIDRAQNLYLAVEKDSQSRARIFKVNLSDDFWQRESFVEVNDAGLDLPTFSTGNHPINALTVVYPQSQNTGYLLAAARNTNQLWVIDLSQKQATKIIKLAFLAPSIGPECTPYHLMNNASIEGIALGSNEIYLINDPWKVNYQKNVNCEANALPYELYAPLLFTLPISDSFFN